ncbi:unnamed protein product [Choristocarpus tenellus]
MFERKFLSCAAMGDWKDTLLSDDHIRVRSDSFDDSRWSEREIEKASMAIAALVMALDGFAEQVANKHNSPSEAFQALRNHFRRSGITERANMRSKLNSLHLPAGEDPSTVIMELDSNVKKMRSLDDEPSDEEQLGAMHNCLTEEYFIEIRQVTGYGRAARMDLQQQVCETYQLHKRPLNRRMGNNGGALMVGGPRSEGSAVKTCGVLAVWRTTLSIFLSHRCFFPF